MPPLDVVLVGLYRYFHFANPATASDTIPKSILDRVKEEVAKGGGA